MFPRIYSSPLNLKKEKVVSALQSEEYLKNLIARGRNDIYKPWKDKTLKQELSSPFGRFPKDFVQRSGEKNLIKTAEKIKEDEYEKKQKSKSLHYDKIKTNKKPIAGAYYKRSIPISDFHKFYERGDLPLKIDHHGISKTIVWKTDPQNLDYHLYLPIFFDGLREKTDPFRMMAIYGLFDLLEKGSSKILDCVPQLIIPIKTNLNTRDIDIVALQIKMIQKLIFCCNLAGQALVPYYRQILPIFRLFYNKNCNLGDKIDYSQRKNTTLGDLIEETLQIMEKYGGDDAFVNIKYIIPTYESCCY